MFTYDDDVDDIAVKRLWHKTKDVTTTLRFDDDVDWMTDSEMKNKTTEWPRFVVA